MYITPTPINDNAINKLPIISKIFLPNLSTNKPAMIVNVKFKNENNKFGIVGLWPPFENNLLE